MSATADHIPPTVVAPTKAKEWPRITIVTPVYNGERYIEATIRSIVDQGYPNVEYFIVDGGSTDGTVELIRKYEKEITGWLSEPDKGMYDAINKGFARSTGEIMGWLNANDKLHTNSLFVVGSVFRDLPDVDWITGRRTIFSEDGMTVAVEDPMRLSRHRFLADTTRTIQQESTFWRRSLWNKAGGYVDDSGRFGIAGDFELWVRFFRDAQLYPVNALIGGWRAHRDSGYSNHMAEYQRIQDQVVEAELGHTSWGGPLKLLRLIARALKPVPIVRGIWRRVVTNSIYYMPGPDWPPVIEYKWDVCGFRPR